MHKDNDSQFDMDDMKEMVRNTYFDFMKKVQEKKKVNEIFEETNEPEALKKGATNKEIRESEQFILLEEDVERVRQLTTKQPKLVQQLAMSDQALKAKHQSLMEKMKDRIKTCIQI